MRHINQQNHLKMKKLSIVAALLFAFGTVAFAQDKKADAPAKATVLPAAP